MIPRFGVIFLASVISFTCNWQFGYQITYINTAVNDYHALATKAHSIQNQCSNCNLSYSNWSQKWGFCVSSFYPGTFLGFILVPLFVSRMSLKSLLTISCIPAIFGCIIHIFIRFFANFGEFSLYSSIITSRFLIGIHSGISLCLLPIYFIETSIQSNRAFLSCLQQVFQSISTLLGLICGSDVLFHLGAYKLEYLQIIGLIPTLFFFVILLNMPETPSHILSNYVLLDSDSSKLFERSTRFYMGKDADVEEFKLEIYEKANVDFRPNRYRFTSRENLKGLLIGSIAAISFAFTGDDVIDSYSSQIIFRHTKGSSLTDSEAITIFLGIVLVITSIFGAILMDKFGNKRLLIVGLIGTAVFNVIASVGSLFGSTMIVTIGFSLTKSCIGLGAGAPSWFLTSELVSANVTSICQAISTGLLLMSVGLITSIYLPLDSHLNELSTLVVLSFPATFCAIFMFLFLPETKNRRLERIRSHLGTHFFTGFVQFPKDDQSRRSTSTYLKKDRLHSYGSMGTLRLPSLSQNSSGNDSLRFHNKYVF